MRVIPDLASSNGLAPLCCDATSMVDALNSLTNFKMINVILALVPLSFATGSLIWLMTSGAQAQARSDAFAKQWMRDNA